MFRGAQDGWNGNWLLICPVIVASDGGSHRGIEEARAQAEAARLRLLNIRSTRRTGGIGIVQDERFAAIQAIAKKGGFQLRRALHIAADVRVSCGEMVFEVRRFAGTGQTDKDYGLRHRSNLGGRAPRRAAPVTGM